jgi:hypothetical protein
VTAGWPDGRETAPVMARSGRTGRSSASDVMAVMMAHPADGPDGAPHTYSHNIVPERINLQ